MNIRTLVLLVILAIVCPPITGGAIGFHTPFGSSGGGGTATDITFDNTKASIPNNPDTVQEMGEELKTLIDNVGTTGVNFSGMAETTDTTGIDSRQMILENSGTVNKITWANIISAIKASLTGFFQPDDADLDSLSSGITGPVLGLGDGSGYQALQLASELALNGNTLGLNATLDLTGYTIDFGLEDSDIPAAIARDNELPTASSLHLDDVLTALGIASEDVHFGTFTGTTIDDNLTAKAIFQALETAIEGIEVGDPVITGTLAAVETTTGVTVSQYWGSDALGEMGYHNLPEGGTFSINGLEANTTTTGIDAYTMPIDNGGTSYKMTWATIIDAISAALSSVFQAADTSLTNIAANWTVDESGNVSGMGTIEPTPTEHPQAVLYDSNAPGSTTAEKAMAYLWGEYEDGADDAENSSAGIAARAAGSWFDWIWYDKTVDQVKVARDLDVDGDVIAKSLTITKVSGVPSSILRYEADGTSTLGIGELGPADISETWYAQDSNDQPNNSIPVYGQPTGTSGPGGTKISAKTWKSAPTGDIVGTSDTQTLTNKTLDANGTGNTVKGYGYLVFTKPSSFGGGVTQQTTATARTYGQALFADDTDSASNFIEYEGVVPYDLDANVEWEAFFKFILGGADTGDHDYVIGMASIADSEANSASIANTTGLTFSADASGAQGDVETASGTLTGWAEAVSAGEKIIIRVARDGDDAANDSSTVDSYSDKLVIRYGFSQ